MGSVKDMPYKPTVPNDVFVSTFNQMFGEPIPKKEEKPKDKEGGKDGRGKD